MTDDFKKYIQNYEKSPEVSARKKKKEDKKGVLLFILLFGFIASCNYLPLFVLWLPYLLFVVIYSGREWVG